MRKWFGVGVLMTAFSVAVAPSADAHPTTSFDGCVRVAVPGEQCGNKAEAGVGTPLVLKAVVRPRHNAEEARVWRLRPHAETWTKVASVPISEGRMRFRWTPHERDVYNLTSWRFRFVIPNHGSGDTIKVRVRSDDF